jgi:hypothetical protein
MRSVTQESYELGTAVLCTCPCFRRRMGASFARSARQETYMIGDGGMADDEGAIDLGKARFRARHLFMVLLLIVTAACGIAGVVTRDELVLVGANSGLLVAFVLYAVDNATRAETKARQIHNDVGRIERLRGPEHIYDLGIAALNRAQSEGQWECVRIYAPTGLWDQSEKKLRWLERLAEALRRQEVRELRAVYGLPEQRAVFREVAAGRLKLFEDSPEARLHFLPPPGDGHPCAAPAFGILIFERSNDYLVYVACSGRAGDPIAGSGFGLQAGNLGRVVASWFDEQVFHGVSAPYVLKGPNGGGPTVVLADGIKRADAAYQLERRRAVPAEHVVVLPTRDDIYDSVVAAIAEVGSRSPDERRVLHCAFHHYSGPRLDDPPSASLVNFDAAIADCIAASGSGGWEVRELFNITSEERLEAIVTWLRQHPDAEGHELRTFVLPDIIPHASPLIVGRDHTFLALGDPRYFRVNRGILIRGERATALMTEYVTGMWNDPRAYDLRPATGLDNSAIECVRDAIRSLHE